jgi:hypothetical protein
MVLHPGIRERVLKMKNIFAKYNKNLCAVIIIARKD